jgi:small subunit ribosomal protein S1
MSSTDSTRAPSFDQAFSDDSFEYEGNSGESFASLFEQQARVPTKQRGVRVGESVQAMVIQVGRESVFVELGGKRQGFLDIEDFRASDGTVAVKEGDKVTAQVLEIDGRTGTIRLGRSLGRATNLGAIEQARAAGLPVEGKVTGVNKGGLDVDLGSARGFCPISQADNKFVQDAGSFVGRSLQFLVKDIRDGGKNIVLSRRALLEREGQEAASRVLKDLQPGAQIRGTVSSVRDFGAFVDLGGMEGLIPASEISHERHVAVADRLKAGDVVDVLVREVKQVPNPKTGENTAKVTLSLKALTEDPWANVGSQLQAGQVVVGSVTRLSEFGAFLRVAPGIEGLLHQSELGSQEKGLTVGANVPVVIKSVDAGAKRVALVPAPDGAVAGARVQPVSIAVGSVVQGKVDRIETYGVFVQLEGTKGRAGRGLIPVAELGVARGTDLRKAFPEGTSVTAKVLEVGEGRLRLSVRGAKDDDERRQYEGYRSKSAASASMGTLGDLLKGKLNPKK